MKKHKLMDCIIAIIGIFILVFTVTMIVLFIKYQSIPDTLCTCVFGVCTGEAGFMALIQSTKQKYRDWEKEDKDDKIPRG